MSLEFTVLLSQILVAPYMHFVESQRTPYFYLTDAVPKRNIAPKVPDYPAHLRHPTTSLSFNGPPSESPIRPDKYSDFTATCGNREWKVGEAIIYPQSHLFWPTRLNIGSIEAQQDGIDLVEDDAEICRQSVGVLVYERLLR